VHTPRGELAVDAGTATTLYAAASSASTGTDGPSSLECAAAIEALLVEACRLVCGQPCAAIADGVVAAHVEVDHMQLCRNICAVDDSPAGGGGGGGALCIELKPKCGVMAGEPLSLLFPARCRHCLYVRHKEARAGLGRTAFCPLDLYSSERRRVRRAVRALVDTCASSTSQTAPSARARPCTSLRAPARALTFYLPAVQAAQQPAPLRPRRCAPIRCGARQRPRGAAR
jgi:hypothetical protein